MVCDLALCRQRKVVAQRLISGTREHRVANMLRRTFLSGLLSAPVVGASVRDAFADEQDSQNIEQLQHGWRALLAPHARVSNGSDPLIRTDEEWERILSPIQYQVLRKEGTERPFSSALNGEKRPGVYVCSGCDLPVFSSAMKYDSGTGWPSFFTTIPDALENKRDFLLILPRTEYHCVRCGGHHGHVFGDGPGPTYERWCNNGVALRFIPS